MSSEIGNKSLLRQLGDYFKVVSVKQSPGQLNTEEIQVTADIISFEDSLLVGGQFTNPIAMVGKSAEGVVLIGTTTYPGLATSLWPKIIGDFEDKEFKLIQMFMEVTYDAAGAAADAAAGVVLTLTINIQDQVGEIYPVVTEDWACVDAAITVPNIWNFPQGVRVDEVGGTFDWIQQGPGWNGRIPYGFRLFFAIGRRLKNGGAAGNFPANTVLTGRAIIHKRQSGLKNSLIW